MANAVLSKSACPKCRDRGEDTSGDNLINYADGGSHCFACGYNINSAYSKSTDKGDIPSPSYPINVTYIPTIKGIISEETLTQFEVFQLEEEGEGTGVAVYPYYDFEGNLTGVKYRDFNKESKNKKIIWWHGAAHSFFGTRVTSDVSDTIIVCEGESDTMYMKQVFPYHTCVGVSGCDSISKSIKAASMWLRTKFKNIYLCFDNDAAGKKCLDQALPLLPKWRTYVMSLPIKKKDVCECTEKEIKKSFTTATQLQGSDIITGDTLTKDFYKWKAGYSEDGGIPTGFPQLDEMLGGGGLQKGELLCLVAHTGRGKSTFVANIVYNMICEGTKVLWVGTEMLPNQMLIKFIERHTGMAYRDKFGKIQISTSDEEDALKFLTKHICFYNNLYGDASKVYEAITNSVMVHDVEMVVVDVLQDCDEQFGDYKIAAQIVKTLKDLAQGNPDERQPPIAIIAVQHTVQRESKESTYVSLAEIRGGGAVKQTATCIIALNGIPSESIRQLTLLKKSRMMDSDTPSCFVEYIRDNKKYIEVEKYDV